MPIKQEIRDYLHGDLTNITSSNLSLSDINYETTKEPTDQELAILREKVDPGKVIIGRSCWLCVRGVLSHL